MEISNALDKVSYYSFTIFGLAGDFSKDKGKHRKAKIYHFVLLMIFIISFGGSFATLGYVIRHTQLTNIRVSLPIGIFSRNVSMSVFYINLILSIITLYFAYGMIARKNSSREKFLKFLPFLAVSSIFNFYKGWIQGGEKILEDVTILLIGFIIFFGISFIYTKIYNSKYMLAFFNDKVE